MDNDRPLGMDKEFGVFRCQGQQGNLSPYERECEVRYLAYQKALEDGKITQREVETARTLALFEAAQTALRGV